MTPLARLEADMLAKWERYVEANDRVVKPLTPDVRDLLSRLIADAHFARDVWEIGRDYGIDAALLFKLSDGNADPRYRDKP